MLKRNPRKEPVKGAKAAKRKAVSLEMKPEKERIFQDKIFYYIPDDDVAPLRRMRITKARSYGATWAKEWDSKITHIIVDMDLNFEQIMKWLQDEQKVLKLPPGVILVNDTYPLECIRWGRVLDPHQPAYKVVGSDAANSTAAQPEKSQQSETSLKVKERRQKRRDGGPPILSPVDGGKPIVAPVRAESSIRGDYVANFVESPTEASPSEDMTSFGDALDEIITTARRMPHLDVDDDYEQPSPAESAEECEGSGSEGERNAKPASRSKRRKVNRGTLNESTFSCMKGGTGNTLESNPNKRTIELLQELADYYDRVKDTWRTYSYRKAIGTLKRQTEKISTYEDAIALDTIGERLAKKIEEIAQTDRLQRLENALLDPGDRLLQVFMKVYGAGITQAEKWIKAGYKSLDELIASDALTLNQRIGVEHYKDFNTRIPRCEVTALGKIIQDVAFTIDSSVKIIIGGSYRRGASSSGDIDCIVTKPGTTSSADLLRFLGALVARLTASSFLVAALAVPSARTERGSKWHGACVLPPPAPQVWRRVDLLLVPATELGAALIYFTGNDIFNRSVRLLASARGMRLNQRGLYEDVMRGPGGVKLSEGTLVEGADERRIFEILGVPWRRPEDRTP